MKRYALYQSFDGREIIDKIRAMDELGLDWSARVVYIKGERAYEAKTIQIEIPRESLSIKPSEDPLPSGEDDTD